MVVVGVVHRMKSASSANDAPEGPASCLSRGYESKIGGGVRISAPIARL